MLKSDLHIHTSMDRYDDIKYSPEEFIDFASSLGFEVLSFTHHNLVYFTEDLKNYAKKKGILLIPGVELTIKGAHVLVYNVTEDDVKDITTLDHLKKLKRKKKDIFIIAPHPFYHTRHCLKNNLIKHIKLFDAIEYCHFYSKYHNPNDKAVEVAKKYRKPLIGTSDSHKIFQFNNTYTMIDSKKDIASIFKAIRANKVKLVTRPLSLFTFFKITVWVLISFAADLFIKKP